MASGRRERKGIFVLTGVLWASVTAAFAIQVSPPRWEFTLPPGESAHGSFEVANELTEPIRVHVSAKDWFVLPQNKGAGVDQWLSLTEKQFDLEPGQKKTVGFTVTPGACSVRPEGVLVGMASFLQETQTQTGVSSVISVSVYAVMAGTEKKDAAVTDFGLRVKDAHLQVGVVLENKGNVHLRPQGRIELRKSDAVLAMVPLEEGRPVYPGQKRSFIGSVPCPKLKSGRYRAVLFLKLWDKDVEQSYRVRVNGKGELKLLDEGKPS